MDAVGAEVGADAWCGSGEVRVAVGRGGVAVGDAVGPMLGSLWGTRIWDGGPSRCWGRSGVAVGGRGRGRVRWCVELRAEGILRVPQASGVRGAGHVP